MNSGFSTHFEKWHSHVTDIGFASSSMTHSGWCNAISKLRPSSCRDFLRLCNSCKLHRERKLSQYLPFKSPFIEIRGLADSADFPVSGFARIEIPSRGGHPRDAKRDRWSAIVWGRRTAKARSTLWSTAETRRAHSDLVFITDARISSIWLRELMTLRQISYSMNFFIKAKKNCEEGLAA